MPNQNHCANRISNSDLKNPMNAIPPSLFDCYTRRSLKWMCCSKGVLHTNYFKTPDDRDVDRDVDCNKQGV
jgi:hypothetical protein